MGLATNLFVPPYLQLRRPGMLISNDPSVKRLEPASPRGAEHSYDRLCCRAVPDLYVEISWYRGAIGNLITAVSTLINDDLTGSITKRARE